MTQLARLAAAGALAACLGCAHVARGRTPAPAGHAATLRDSFADPDLVTLLSEWGYEPDLVATGSITFMLERARVVLFNQWGGDLQLYYVVTGGTWDAAQVNEWNRTRRLCRAYLDKDGDLVLEADLLALGGLTEEQVSSFVSVFERALTLFIEEVAATDALGGRPTEPPSSEPEPERSWH